MLCNKKGGDVLLCGKIYIERYFDIVTNPKRKLFNFQSKHYIFMFKAGIAFIGFWIPNVVKLRFLYGRASAMYQGRENDICPLMKYNSVSECIFHTHIKEKIKCYSQLTHALQWWNRELYIFYQMI